MELPISLPNIKPAVFLSSQIGVFKEERKLLADMIERELQLLACRFEGTSRPHPPQNVYKAYLEQSHFFVGIYGAEYGWIDQDAGMQISGIHDEWRIASERDMPRIAFVRTDEPKDARLRNMIRNEVARDITYAEFSTAGQLVSLVKQSLQQLLYDCILAGLRGTGTALPNYAEMLVRQYDGQFIIATSFLTQELQPLVDKSSRVFLYGPPGCGKTVCLMLLGKRQNCIYVSLRDKSRLAVISYLADCTAQTKGNGCSNYSSPDLAMAACEEHLRTGAFLVLVDEVDQNPDAARVLLFLHPGKSKIVFAGRGVPPYLEPDISTIGCSGFTPSEAEVFTQKLAPNSQVSQQREAIRKSAGNPQYLVYYCISHKQEPPDNLDLYHARIYAELSPNQQEILAILSVSETPFFVTDLAKALSNYRKTTVTGIAAKNEVQSLARLVAETNGVLAVFHPAIQEYVRGELRRSGLIEGIHRALASVYDSRGEMPFAIFHRVCAGDGDSVYGSLPRAEDTAYLMGFMRVARRLYAEDIRLSKSKHDLHRLGYALYHTSLSKKDVTGNRGALRTAQLAERIFTQAGDTEWVHVTRATSATFMVDLGRDEEAVGVLEEMADHAQAQGLIHLEALARTNLAFVYSRIGRVDDIEVQSLRAKDLCTATGDRMGQGVNLLNLNNAYVAKGDSEKTLRTCRELQKIAKELHVPRLEAGAALNGLTAYHRRKGRYTDAEQAANRAIDIASMLGDWDCLATNLGNLGNVYRDQGDAAKAEECYKESMRIGQEKEREAHVAHGMASLADLADNKEDYATAIDLGQQALDLWRHCGNTYRIAVTSIGQAQRILLRAGFDWKEAIPLLEDGARRYMDVGLYDDALHAYTQLMEVHLNHFARTEASSSFSEALSHFSSPEHVRHFSRLLEGLKSWDDRVLVYVDAPQIVRTSLQCLSSSTTKSDLFSLIRSVVSAIKRVDPDATLFFEFVRGLAAKYSDTPSPWLAIGLAIAIEQVPSSISSGRLTSLFRVMGSLCTSLIYRHEPWLDDQWFVVFNASNSPMVEIRSLDNTNVRVVSAVAAILLWAESALLVDETKHSKWTSIGWLLQGIPEHEARKWGLQLPPYFPGSVPVCLGTAVSEDGRLTMTGMIASSTYLSQADHCQHPYGYSLIGLNMQLIDFWLRNFMTDNFRKRRGKRIRRKFIPYFFDVHYAGEKS